MNFVQPIRDRKKIAQIKSLLRGQRRYRDLLLFVVGVNTALRISDLLTLHIGHFIDEQQRPRQRFTIHEQKRGKRLEVVINQSIQEAFDEFLEEYHGIANDPNHFVFFNIKDKTIPPQSIVFMPGTSSTRFVKMSDYGETSVHIVYEKLGGIMPACKVLTWHSSCTSSITQIYLLPNVI